MSGWTAYGANAILSGTPLPQTLYVQLHDGDPGDGTANLCVETDRQAITLEASVEPYTVVNDASVSWTNLPANETASHISLWDASSAGNCWAVGRWEPASAPLDLQAGGSLDLNAGDIQLVLSLSGEAD